MLERRENKLFFGAKAKFFVFIANLNSTSRIIFGIRLVKFWKFVSKERCYRIKT